MNTSENAAPPSHDVANTPAIATAHFCHDSLYLAAATYVNKQIKLSVPKGLTRRRVYAAFLDSQAIDASVKSNQAFAGRLDLLLQGNLVYRAPFDRYASLLSGFPATRVSVRLACSEAQSDAGGAPVYPGFQPAIGDSLLSTIGNTEHVCPALNINIACDAVVLTLDTMVLGAIGGFLLACHSEGET